MNFVLLTSRAYRNVRTSPVFLTTAVSNEIIASIWHLTCIYKFEIRRPQTIHVYVRATVRFWHTEPVAGSRVLVINNAAGKLITLHGVVKRKPSPSWLHNHRYRYHYHHPNHHRHLHRATLLTSQKYHGIRRIRVRLITVAFNI